jgi:eukaryotic-like serine/threonine-protein kinase
MSHLMRRAFALAIRARPLEWSEMRERYRLTRLFAQGGMAEVYLGVAAGAEGFEKPVAIKRILPHLARDEKIARMFLAEARLATFLSHQNIVQVIDVGRGPDGLFIVMELVNGWDLGVVIDQATKEKTTIPAGLAAFVVSQALAGLRHAYKQTYEGKPILMAHRDVSVSNILISAEGEVKVADFGIARLQAPLNRTEPGTFKGKIAYAAPEVIHGQPASAKSDQFALGIVLHEMLTGVHPFGRFENAMTYVDAIVTRPPAPLPGAPALLAQIVSKALTKDPQERFDTPELFARALAQFLASSGMPSTSQELADFTRGLAMPTLPLDLAGQDTVIRERLPGSFSLKGVPSLKEARAFRSDTEPADDRSWQAAEMEAMQKDWAPHGPELDPSGELHGAAVAPAPTPAPTAAPSPGGIRRLSEVKNIELAVEPNRSEVNATNARAQRQAAPLDAEFLFPKRRTGAARWIKWIALASIAGACVLKWPELYALISERLPLARHRVKATPILSIESEPSGAKIQIGSEVLGQTPLFIENIYPKTQIEVKLSLKGYQPWTGKFAGGQAAELKATLRRR